MQSAWQSVGKPNGIQNRNETLQEWEMKKIEEHKGEDKDKESVKGSEGKKDQPCYVGAGWPQIYEIHPDMKLG